VYHKSRIASIPQIDSEDKSPILSAWLNSDTTIILHNSHYPVTMDETGESSTAYLADSCLQQNQGNYQRGFSRLQDGSI